MAFSSPSASPVCCSWQLSQYCWRHAADVYFARVVYSCEFVSNLLCLLDDSWSHGLLLGLSITFHHVQEHLDGLPASRPCSVSILFLARGLPRRLCQASHDSKHRRDGYGHWYDDSLSGMLAPGLRNAKPLSSDLPAVEHVLRRASISHIVFDACDCHCC
jgi:hypothetical protein